MVDLWTKFILCSIYTIAKKIVEDYDLTGIYFTNTSALFEKNIIVDVGCGVTFCTSILELLLSLLGSTNTISPYKTEQN